MNLDVNWAPGITLESMEKACILQALKFYRGNVNQTAISLGVSDKTIRNKLDKYEQDGKLQRERYEADKLERARILDRMRGIQPGATGEPARPNLHRADTGVHMEPAPQVPAQQQVSMSERQEIQNVLPGSVAPSGKPRGRPRLSKADGST